MEKQNKLTELEKLLYNKHLAVSRSLKNKPFRIKKDFTDIVDTDKHKFLKRISVFFKKHSSVDPDTFFKAPYMLYPDVEYFGLDFFSTMRAIKSYTLYKKQIFIQDPDSQIESVKDSLRFIANFCIEKRIQFYQYSNFRLSDTFAWLAHYKENKINIYSIMEYQNTYSSVKSLSEDIQHMFAKDFIENFQTLHSNYNNSTHLKKYMQKAIPAISMFIEKQLTQIKNALSSN